MIGFVVLLDKIRVSNKGKLTSFTTYADYGRGMNLGLENSLGKRKRFRRTENIMLSEWMTDVHFNLEYIYPKET